MAEERLEALRGWFESTRPAFEALAKTAGNTIEGLIRHAGIDYLSVTSRAKSVVSFIDKAQKKQYKKPEEQITDLAGVRVITFIESDVARVGELVESSFHPHPALSLDKTDELGIDRFGYRSVHFVCDLGAERCNLPEFSMYKNLVFEVQVRTVLQHAWAEIEHDRNYKFAGILPTPIQRRLYLLAGVLEIVDREFVTLAGEIDKYVVEVSEKTRAGDLDIEINTPSLFQYLPQKLDYFKERLIPIDSPGDLEPVIDELRGFGIQTLADLEPILNDQFFSALDVNHESQPLFYIGALRDAMMYSDLDKYFSDAWSNSWQGTEEATVSLLSGKYGRRKVRATFGRNEIDILDDAFLEEDDDDQTT